MSKIYLDECYLCHESKAAIKHSQSIKNPIYCGIMSGGLESELMEEYDHHIFVVTEKQIKADEEAEKQMYKDMAEMYDPWLDQSDKKEEQI
jgi:hypothetical protein